MRCSRAAASLLAVTLPNLILEPKARAQDAPELIALVEQSKASSEEIVIVALGRGADPFDAPASIVRLDEETLRQRAIRSLDELAQAVPGLYLIRDQDPGTNILSLRGTTSDRLQAAAVAFLVDGVLLADTELFTAPLFDLADVQIVRGPQGALFGKNAAGGVLALATRTGGDGFGGYARALYGSGDRREFEAALGGPLGGGFGLRAAGYWTDFKGLITNSFLDQRVDAEERRALRLSADWQGGPLRLVGKVQWLEEDGGAAYASSGDITGDFGGRLSGAALTAPLGDFPGSAYRRWLNGTVRARADFGALRAHLTLARDIYNKRFTEELDYRNGPLTFFGAPLFPDGLQPIAQPVDIHASTLDVGVEGDFASLTWRITGFIQDLDRDRVDDFGPLLFGAPPSRFETDSLQTAGAISLDWAASERLTLSAAVRRDADQRSQTILVNQSGALIEQRRETFARWQPQAAVRFALNPKAQLYLAYGEAFRTGGFNPIPPPGAIFEAVFAPEVVRSLEGGLKLRDLPLDGHFEITGFASRTQNYQNYAFFDGNSVALSVDAVRTQGLEISASLKPLPGWVLASSFALADAKIARFIAPDPLDTSRKRDLSGNRLPNVPAWTTTFSITYTRQLARDWHLTARADLNGVGRTFYEIDNVLFSPARALGDARLEIGYRKLTLAAFAKNITNERFAISAFGQSNLALLQGLGPGGPFDTFTIDRGRQAAIELRVDF